MADQSELQQNDSTTPTETPAASTKKQISANSQQPSQPSTRTSDLPPIKPKPTPPLQEELGKSFASRKIQMASLAIRTSHSASQSPLFMKYDMSQLYQKPFVASSLSTPTPPYTPNDKPRTAPFLPSSSTNDRALLDRTWSVLASKSEPNQQQQHRKKPRRRVTFSDNIEFFELPPQMNYYDDLDQPPTYSSEATHLDENQDEYQQDIESGQQPTLPQIANQWDEPYTNTSNEPSSPELHTPKQIDSYSAPCSVTSSTSTTSSGSMATLSLSSSSTQSNSVAKNDNNNSVTTWYDRRSPLFNQQINASTSLLPAYNSAASSTVSLSLSTNSAPDATCTETPTSQRALQRKGNTISRTAILEILSSRTPSHRHANNNGRSVKHNNKRLSLQQPHHQVPIDFHPTLDSVENEIKQAIQRAKASRAGKTAKTQSSPIDHSSATENQSPTVNGQTVATSDAIPNGNDGNPDNMASAQTNEQPANSNMGTNQIYDDESDSNTLHGENNSSETVYMDAMDGQDTNDDGPHGVAEAETTPLDSISDKPLSPLNPALDSNDNTNSDTSNSDDDSGEEDSNTIDRHHTSNPLLVYLPSPEQQITDFGDNLRDEFDRITGDMTKLAISTPEVIATTMEDGDLKASISTIGVTQGDQLNNASAKMDKTKHEQDHSSIAWQILGCQDENDIAIKNQQQNNDQPLNPPTKGRLYIKVIAAENLDFPINQNAPSIQCSVNDGNHYLGSGHYKMQHDIHFNHEFILDDIKPDTEFTLTLHAIQPDDQNAGTTPMKRWTKRTSFGADDLSRYINRQDGALAQTRVSLTAVSYQCRTRLCTASFALVNGWYQPAKKHGGRYPVLLSRSTKEKRHLMVQEKAVGKLTMELFYVPNTEINITDLPADMDSCENALNIQRFHQTIWLSGYMSQLGGDVKYWRRRYFKLIGGKLYSYTDTHYSPRTMIDISKAVLITSDNRIVMETRNSNRELEDQHQRTPQHDTKNISENDVGYNLLMALETQTNISSAEKDYRHQSPYMCPYNESSNRIKGNDRVQDQHVSTGPDRGGSSTSVQLVAINQNDLRKSLGDNGDDLSSYSVKNGFQLKFDNDEVIEFFCDSAHERERWLDVLKVILGRIPTLPSWLSV